MSGALVTKFTSDEITHFAVYDPAADGITDDTTKLQTAINDTLSRGRSQIYMVGQIVVDGGTLDLSGINPSNTLELVINGRLILTSTLAVIEGMALTGVGHYGGPAFSQTQMAAIQPRGILATNPMVNAKGVGPHKVFRNLSFEQHIGPCLQLGASENDPLAGQSANHTIERCSFLAGDVPTASCIKLENAYWVYIDNCSLVARENSGPTIHVADSYDLGIGNAASGLLAMKESTITAQGILIEGLKAGGFWNFSNVQYESGRTDFITVNKTNGSVYGLRLEDVGIHDPINNLAFINDVSGHVRGPVVTSCPNFLNNRYFKSHTPESYSLTQPEVIANTGAAAQYDEAGYPSKPHIFYAGALDAPNGLRGRQLSQSFLPLDVFNFGVSSDPNDWSVPQNLQASDGHDGPDGSDTAARIVNDTTQSGFVALFSGATTQLTAGAWVISGMWCKAAEGYTAAALGQLFRIQAGQDGVWDSSGTAISGDIHHLAKETTIGWSRFIAFDRIVIAPTLGELTLRAEFFFQNDGRYVWRPFMLALPAIYAKREIVAIADQLDFIAPDAGNGVQASIYPTRTGIGIRPPAAAVGQGAQWYDTTLGKPIWSDGAVWRDSAGTAV